jgi:hypothetical protein
MIPSNKLDFWIKHNYNIILRGMHGVGKTACIKEAFERNNLKWQYYSAATMDPWVDFIGVPKEKTENGITYLDLIRPKIFAEDEIEALFFDEYNRSAAKIRNAVMELIQFKSINGKKFKNLRFVWAAINPENTEEDSNSLEYNVEPVDPAQLDRFHIIYDVPYSLDVSYFKKKYGIQIAEAGSSWWNSLSKEIKLKISPRRLDYALDMFTHSGDLRDVLPKEANIQKLIIEINNGTYKTQLADIVNTNDSEKIKKFINEENNFYNCIDLIVNNDNYIDVIVPLLDNEKAVKLISKYNKVLDYIIQNELKFSQIIIDIIKSKGNKQIVKKLQNKTKVWKSIDNLSNLSNLTEIDQFKKYIEQKTFSSKFKTDIKNNCGDYKKSILTIMGGPKYDTNITYWKKIAYNMILDSIKPSDNNINSILLGFKYIMHNISTMQLGTLKHLNNIEDCILWFAKKCLFYQLNIKDKTDKIYLECEQMLIKLYYNKKYASLMRFDKLQDNSNNKTLCDVFISKDDISNNIWTNCFNESYTNKIDNTINRIHGR